MNKTELVNAKNVLIKARNLLSGVDAKIPLIVGKNTNKAAVPKSENSDDRRS